MVFLYDSAINIVVYIKIINIALAYDVHTFTS